MEDPKMEEDAEEQEESCSEKAIELLQDVTEKYPKEMDIISKIQEIIDALTEVEGGKESESVIESESKDEEPTDYEDMNHEDMRKDMHKKGMIIAVRVK